MSIASESKVASDIRHDKKERPVNAILPDYGTAFQNILKKANKGISSLSTPSERMMTMTIVPVSGWINAPRAVWDQLSSVRYPTSAWERIVTGVRCSTHTERILTMTITIVSNAGWTNTPRIVWDQLPSVRYPTYAWRGIVIGVWNWRFWRSIVPRSSPFSFHSFSGNIINWVNNRWDKK